MKPEANSTNIHVFRVNRTVKNKEQSQSSNRVSPASVPVNSRTSLSAETKRLICEDHINNPRYTQEALASKYGCKRTTVAKIIKSKDRWLAIDSDAAIAKRFRQRSSRYPLVENALILWLEKEHHDLANVTDQMLRCQARQYAQNYSVEGLDDFKASSSWVSNFKQKYLTLKIKESRSDAPVYPDHVSQQEAAQTFTSVFPVGPPTTIVSTSEDSSPDTATGSDDRRHFIVEQWSMPANNTKEPSEAIDQESMSHCNEDDDMPDYTDTCDFDDTVNNTPIDNIETTKLDAKKHLEAALAFYTSQADTSTSMSANMIKLILQNDFAN